MPLFVRDKKAVLYIHVPKTGGSSIEQFFLANGFRAEFLDNAPRNSFNPWRRCSPQHMTAEQLLGLLRPVRMDHIFMTVREPLARLVSEYRMRLRDTPGTPGLELWLRRSLRQYPDDNCIFDNHLRPQSDFWMPGCEVVRQEHGFDGNFVAGLEERLGITFEHRGIGGFNRAEGADVTASEIAAIRPLVTAFYRQDYVRFGYKLQT
jgi:hypothetical protein